MEFPTYPSESALPNGLVTAPRFPVMPSLPADGRKALPNATPAVPSYPFQLRPFGPGAIGYPPYHGTIASTNPPFDSKLNTQTPLWNSSETPEMNLVLETLNLFPKSRFERKRKFPVPDDFRPSKVLITESALAQDLDRLQLEADGRKTSNQNLVPVESDVTTAPQISWANFQEVEHMDVDEPVGKRFCSQLEMSDSLKQAIREVAEAEKVGNNPNPGSILSSTNPCMAIMLYKPPEALFDIRTSAKIVKVKRNASTDDLMSSDGLEGFRIRKSFKPNQQSDELFFSRENAADDVQMA